MERRAVLRGIGGLGAVGLGTGLGYDRGAASRSTWIDAGTVEINGDMAVASQTSELIPDVRVVWSLPVESNGVALTFDDGPDPEFTQRILEVLAHYRLHSTFNVMGSNALAHRDLLSQVIAAGHELGNHTWSHLDEAFVSPDGAAEELRRGKQVLTEAGVAHIRWFRPPRGVLTGAGMRAAAKAGHDILLWSVSATQQPTSTAAEVRDRLLGHVGAGHIVLLHDGIGRGTFDRSSKNAKDLTRQRHTEIDALPSIIEALTAKGLRLDTVSALLDTHPTRI